MIGIVKPILRVVIGLFIFSPFLLSQTEVTITSVIVDTTDVVGQAPT